jgi:hypothetical protein
MDIHVGGKAARPRKPFFASLALMHFRFPGCRPDAAGRPGRALYVFWKKTGTQFRLLWEGQVRQSGG